MKVLPNLKVNLYKRKFQFEYGNGSGFGSMGGSASSGGGGNYEVSRIILIKNVNFMFNKNFIDFFILEM